MTPQQRRQKEAAEPRLGYTIEEIDRLRALLSQTRQEVQRLQKSARHPAGWQPIRDCLMTPGSEIVVKLKATEAGKRDPFWLGKSIHQIGRWDAEGQLWSHNRRIDLDSVAGYIFIPD